jgi:hypothetical protein
MHARDRLHLATQKHQLKTVAPQYQVANNEKLKCPYIDIAAADGTLPHIIVLTLSQASFTV